MNNIFKDAYFGKAYKTRDGRKAIFLQFDTIVNDKGEDIGNLAYIYTIQDGEYSVALNGIETSENDIILHNINTDKLNSDIVSEWTEPITEEELDKLAIEARNEYREQIPFYYEFPHSESDLNIRCMGYIDGFKECYRKVLKQ